MEPGIVNPTRGKRSPHLGGVVIMAANGADSKFLLSRIAAPDTEPAFHRLFMSRLYPNCDEAGSLSLVGPLMGAPYGAALLETLIAWGGTRFLFLGWCGSISSQLSAGDLLLPSEALVDEGTSRHYTSPCQEATKPSAAITRALADHLDRGKIDHTTGAIWTTDAIFRESERKMRHYSSLGALAVEMECSALLAVAACRGVQMATLLVVSDELSTGRWQPGFGKPKFEKGRRQAAEALADLGLNL
jgi:uridine phosphorylase